MMPRRMYVTFLFIVFYINMLLLSPCALADNQVCTKEEAIAAEMAGIAQSWDQLHQQFRRYSHCDDGAISEGFSESVTLLLAEHWQEISQLAIILRYDSAFQKFVILHIDETVPVGRLNRIAENANKRCPRSLKGLCREIEEAVKKSAQTEG